MISRLTSIFWAAPVVIYLTYATSAPTIEEKATRTCEPLILSKMLNNYIIKNVSLASYEEMQILITKAEYYCKHVSYNVYNGQGMESIKAIFDKNIE